MRRSSGGWLAGVFCTGLLAGGCGGPEPGTHVPVDKEKEAVVLKAMEGYMNKQAKGKKPAKANNKL